jgi:hypothetical protein
MVGYSSWWNNREEREFGPYRQSERKPIKRIRWSINKHWLGLFWFSWSIRCGTKRAGRARQTFIYNHQQRNIRYFSGNFYWRNCQRIVMVMLCDPF